MEFSVEPQTEPVFCSFPFGCPPTGGAVCSSHLGLCPLCPKLMSVSNLVFFACFLYVWEDHHPQSSKCLPLTSHLQLLSKNSQS